MARKKTSVAQGEENTPAPKKKRVLSPKELATKKGEPWVDVKMHVDPDQPHNGYFELDWNDAFIDKLKVEGYTGETDGDIMDQYVKALCTFVAGENDEYIDALAKPKINRKDNDDGTSEYF